MPETNRLRGDVKMGDKTSPPQERGAFGAEYPPSAAQADQRPGPEEGQGPLGPRGSVGAASKPLLPLWCETVLIVARVIGADEKKRDLEKERRGPTPRSVSLAGIEACDCNTSPHKRWCATRDAPRNVRAREKAGQPKR